jgi:hypothetical protein
MKILHQVPTGSWIYGLGRKRCSAVSNWFLLMVSLCTGNFAQNHFSPNHIPATSVGTWQHLNNLVIFAMKLSIEYLNTAIHVAAYCCF